MFVEFQFRNYTCPKNPCELRIEKLIFSLNSVQSVGREYGKVNISAHVDTRGRVVKSLKRILGVASA